ncbi:MAG: CatB-related O-acetyltransferase [Fusobacteriaceae bacterium]
MFEIINSIRKKIKNYILIKKLKKNKIFILKNVKLRKNEFESNNIINANVDFENSSLGVGSSIGENSILPHVKIGRFCSIGPGTNIALGKHPTSKFVSTHLFCYSKYLKNIELDFVEEEMFDSKITVKDSKYYVEIGNDVWIGKNVCILSAMKIGDGAIIAAGAVVTKDVEPYTIVGGVPARVIRKRFQDDEIEFLLNFKWWNKPLEWIEKNVNDFFDIKEFIKANTEKTL